MDRDIDQTLRRPQVPGVMLGEPLGKGAFATVYRGRHRTLDIDVAVKLTELALGAGEASRVLEEARLIARLDHPNLLRIYDAGSAGAALYLVLELMDGGSLAAERAVSPHRLHALARQILAGLQALHEAGLVHRDIKPGNVLLRSDGRVKLADFGLARHLDHPGEGTLAGTLPFMAPELFNGEPASPRTDLYAVGVTLACLALEQPPFPQTTAREVVDWARTGPPIAIRDGRSDIPSALAMVVERLAARAPSDRPASAQHALAILESAAPAMASATVTVPSSPWVVGDEISRTPVWATYACTHAATGTPGWMSIGEANSAATQYPQARLTSARLAATLDHEGFVPVYDWALWEGRPVMVCAPLGRSLESWVAAQGPAPEPVALAFGEALAAALEALERAGLVHQLIAPGSVFLRGDGRQVQVGWPWFLVPAGTPARDEHGFVMRHGVLQFAPPETLHSKAPISHEVDRWGLGEVLFFLLSGTPAFKADAPAPMMLAKAQPFGLAGRLAHVTAPTVELVGALLDPSPTRRPAPATIRVDLSRIRRRLGWRS